MSIRGKAYASTNPEALKKILWFFAHEVAHQFQFRDGLTREAGSDWISEGAGNLILHGTRKPLKGICFGVVCPQGQHQLTIAQGLHLDHLPKSMILFT